MANFNSVFFLSLLVAIYAFMAVEAQLPAGLPSLPIISAARITGNVYCALNVTVSSTGSVIGNPPPFPNAVVELRCNGTVTANTTTNGSGSFSLPLIGSALNATQLTAQLINGCRLVVTTPLVNCNASLPAVNGSALISNLQPAYNPPIMTTSLDTFLSIISLLPGGFDLILTL